MSGIATAIVGSAVVGGVLSSNAQKDAAKDAASAQGAAADASVGEQRRQFDAMQKILSPYVQAGKGSLFAQQSMLGLNGFQAAKEQIDQLTRSPFFHALQQQGEEGILQNAAATGGLRGGNVQAALAQFRPQMLNQMMQQQYNNLGNLTQLGQNSAAGVGAAGMNSANSISNILQGQGEAQANAALAGGRANANMWGNIAGSVGTVAGLSKGSFGSF